MIKLINVTREYYLDDETTVVPIKDLSLTINKGEFVMIIGHSGSGKTTLLNLAAGLIRPTSGQVLIDGKDIWTMDDAAVSRLRSEKFGFVFQFPSLIPSLTVIENVALPASFSKKTSIKDAEKRGRDLLEMVGIPGKAGSLPRQLSAGEQRRVVIARALVNRPEILIADEPTSDLDEETERDIMAQFRGIYTSGVTVVMVTHNLSLLSFATRVIKVEKGTAKTAGDTAGYLQLQRLYQQV